MASTVTIYNMALARLNLNQIEDINSPDEDGGVISVCNRVFPVLFKSILQAHDWSFATRSAALALAGQDEHAGMLRYALPSDCVKIIKLEGGGPLCSPHFIRQGDQILTVQAPAVLRYIGKEENPDLWPGTFLEAVVWRLAADLAASITSDRNKQQYCIQMAQQALYQAISVDLNEQNPDPVPSGWLGAR